MVEDNLAPLPNQCIKKIFPHFQMSERLQDNKSRHIFHQAIVVEPAVVFISHNSKNQISFVAANV